MNKFDNYSLCPVPAQQRPFREYITRKESSFLGWVRLNELGYTSKFFFTFFLIFFLTFPIVNWFISLSCYPIQSLIIGFTITLLIEILVYLNFFLAWTYIGERLANSKVVYEETGWYDGKVWTKPQAILRHEQLLFHYQVVPLIGRIKKTLQLNILFTLTFTSFLFLFMY